MTIWTRTRNHYEQSDKNKLLPRWGSVRYPACLNCGSHAIPLTSHNAHCPTCGTVVYVMVPEDRVDEFREEIRKA